MRPAQETVVFECYFKNPDPWYTNTKTLHKRPGPLTTNIYVTSPWPQIARFLNAPMYAQDAPLCDNTKITHGSCYIIKHHYSAKPGDDLDYISLLLFSVYTNKFSFHVWHHQRFDTSIVVPAKWRYLWPFCRIYLISVGKIQLRGRDPKNAKDFLKCFLFQIV